MSLEAKLRLLQQLQAHFHKSGEFFEMSEKYMFLEPKLRIRPTF